MDTHPVLLDIHAQLNATEYIFLVIQGSQLNGGEV
jgi:hypothetical protein